MGYTHYFHHKNDIPRDAWRALCHDFEHMRVNLPKRTATAGGAHETDPLAITLRDQEEPAEAYNSHRERIIERGAICFNGAPAGENLDHEDFLLFRTRGDAKTEPLAGFCKTARKPYDLVVCAVLLRAYQHAPHALAISSDGRRQDWQPAIDWVHQLFGEQALPTFLYDPSRDAGDADLATRAR